MKAASSKTKVVTDKVGPFDVSVKVQTGGQVEVQVLHDPATVDWITVATITETSVYTVDFGGDAVRIVPTNASWRALS